MNKKIANKKSVSIFTIERRIDFDESYKRFIENLKRIIVSPHHESSLKIIGYLERCLKYWPYRQLVSCIDEYLSQIGVNYEHPESELECILTLDLFINLLYYTDVVERRPLGSYSFIIEPSGISRESERLVQNA